jgi:hypothetical protein
MGRKQNGRAGSVLVVLMVFAALVALGVALGFLAMDAARSVRGW